MGGKLTFSIIETKKKRYFHLQYVYGSYHDMGKMRKPDNFYTFFWRGMSNETKRVVKWKKVDVSAWFMNFWCVESGWYFYWLQNLLAIHKREIFQRFSSLVRLWWKFGICWFSILCIKSLFEQRDFLIFEFMHQLQMRLLKWIFVERGKSSFQF